MLGASESVVVNGNVKGWRIAGNHIHDNNNIGIDAIGYEGHDRRAGAVDERQPCPPRGDRRTTW